MFCRGRNPKERFPHHNWAIIIVLLLSLAYTVFILFTPSIYQFVTTAQNSSENEVNGSCNIWPGLGGTETDYALAFASSALFEFITFPLSLFLIGSLPFTPLLLLTCTLYTAGGVLYGFATNVWMVFAARAIMGMGVSFGMTILNTYIGENGTYMDTIREKKMKRPLKPVLYTTVLLISVVMQVVLLGINSALVRISSVDPYRLPGWTLGALGAISAAVVLLFFQETRPWTCSSLWGNMNKCPRHMFSLKSKSKTIRDVIKTVFIVAISYSNGQVYTILIVLVSPLLSDQFGFTVANTSLYLVGLIAATFLSVLFLIASAALKISNRTTVMLSLVVSLVGCALIGDWQAITTAAESEPCSLYSSMINETNVPHLICESANITGFQNEVDSCQAQSTSGHQCFWNPQSRVTGEYCSTCLSTCLSHQTSLNFYQFSLGVVLLTSGSLLLYVLVPALASDTTPPNNQGRIMAIIFATLGLCRILSPLWYVESYEMTGRHTYLIVSVNIATNLVIIAALVALYTKLAPNNPAVEAQRATNATFFRTSQELTPTEAPESSPREDIVWCETEL